VSDPSALRFLASQYASMAAHRPLPSYSQRGGLFTVDAFEELELLDADEARAWRERLRRLAVDPVELPLLARSVRDAATEYMHAEEREGRGFASQTLQAVGALSWADAHAARTPIKLLVDRVIAVAPTAASWLTLSSVVLYLDAIEICWYASPSAPLVSDVTAPNGLRSPFGLELFDDRGTSYAMAAGSSSGDPERPSHGRTTFEPALADGTTWVEVRQGGTALVRVPL
jgi:hypothetical protein